MLNTTRTVKHASFHALTFISHKTSGCQQSQRNDAVLTLGVSTFIGWFALLSNISVRVGLLRQSVLHRPRKCQHI